MTNLYVFVVLMVFVRCFGDLHEPLWHKRTARLNVLLFSGINMQERIYPNLLLVL